MKEEETIGGTFGSKEREKEFIQRTGGKNWRREAFSKI